MGYNAGNGNIVTNGLLLYYDMNNPKCYRGESGSNLIDSTAADSAGNAASYNGGTISNNNYEKLYKSFKCTTVAGNALSDGILIGDGTMRAAGIYSLSLKVWVPKGHTIGVGFSYLPQGQELPVVIDGNNAWVDVKRHGLVTSESGALKIQATSYGPTWSSAYPDDYFTFWVRQPMIVTGSYAKMFVNGSRMTNAPLGGGGLINLVGSSSNGYNGTINSNVTFDTDGFYCSTNGSTAIEIPCISGPLNVATTGSFTYDTWFKVLGDPPGANDGYFFGRIGIHNGFVSIKGDHTTIATVVWHKDFSTSNGTPFTAATNVWTHGAFVVDHNARTIKTYKNGVLNGTVTYTKELANHNNASYFILGAGTDYTANVRVGNCKIYNRALSSGEILQNFFTHKKLYGF